MKLSVYVNLRSIGWIISDANSVIARGIKRINLDFDNYYEYMSGLPVSKRVNRRIKRQMRRNLWRRHSRRQNLTKYLDKKGCKVERTYSATEMFRLRVRALDEMLTPSELASVFLSLQRKRGYKSMRGVNDGGDSEYLSAIAYHEEQLTHYRSIADYCLTLESVKNVIFTRESYEAEFMAICKAQKLEDVETLWKLIYFQRPLRKGKIANCSLEKNRKVCHYSSPDFQKFRIWRDVNNITITSPTYEEVDIPESVRHKWVNDLMAGKSLTKAKCCKDLGIKKATGYSWMSGKQLQGNVVVALLGEDNAELWQEIFSAVDDNQLRMLLSTKYLDKDVEALMDVDFNSFGWAEYSHKAIMKLLPLMQQGMKLKEAILDVYGEVAMDADVSLRNLVVEQHYASYKSLIGKLKEKFPIDETAIEISPLLKTGNKGRKQMAKSNRIAERAKTNSGLTDYQQHLIELWEETNHVSPYEPDVVVTKEELLTNYNVDHIVPKSKLFEHGRINQTICRIDLNKDKGSMTGIEFAQHLGIEEEYRKFIDSLKLSERKKQFFMMPTEAIPTSYFGEPDYITRCFARDADYVIPNKIVNKYYRDWNLDTYPDNDVRSTLMKCLVVANFSNKSIDYFNNLKSIPTTEVGRYNIAQAISCNNVEQVIPYVPRPKYYRRTKFGFIPRFSLHDESVMGKRIERVRGTDGAIQDKTYYKIRKPISQLTPAMVGKVIDGKMRKIINSHFEGKTHEQALLELTEKPLIFNGKPIKNVSIKINACKLVELPYGYCYSSMAHRVDTVTGAKYTYIDYINGLNKGQRYEHKGLKTNDIVKYNDNYYFIVGATETPLLRSVYELNAVALRTNKTIMATIKSIYRVNELGEIREEKL